MDQAIFPIKLDDPSLLHHQSYIQGQWVDADDGSHFQVDNPANGQTIAYVANSGPAATTRAINAANAAWPQWRALTAKARAGILRRWFDLIIANTEDLARIMTTEQGKPLAEARGEVAYGASFVEWFAEQGKRIMGDTIDAPIANTRILVLREPIGVCAAITPWF